MTRNAILKMITVWIAAFLVYGPAILSFVKPANRHKCEKKASILSPLKKASRLSLHKLENQSLNLNVNWDLPPLQVEVKTKPHRNGFYKTTQNICNTTSRVDIANTMANRFRLSQDKRVAKIFSNYCLCVWFVLGSIYAFDDHQSSSPWTLCAVFTLWDFI